MGSPRSLRDARRDDRRAARRAQLLDDAVEAIREVGPGATMDQLARRGGVTKPILYRHFRDRDGLISALADRFTTELLSEIDAALQAAVPAGELLRTTVDAYLRLLERDPDLYRFLLHQVGRKGDGFARISPLIDTIAQRVAMVVGAHLRAVSRDPTPALPWAYGIVGSVHQAGDWWLGHRTLSREELTDHLTAMLWDGLQTAANPPPS